MNSNLSHHHPQIISSSNAINNKSTSPSPSLKPKMLGKKAGGKKEDVPVFLKKVRDSMRPVVAVLTVRTSAAVNLAIHHVIIVDDGDCAIESPVVCDCGRNPFSGLSILIELLHTSSNVAYTRHVHLRDSDSKPNLTFFSPFAIHYCRLIT